jgi:hypothetical protein
MSGRPEDAAVRLVVPISQVARWFHSCCDLARAQRQCTPDPTQDRASRCLNAVGVTPYSAWNEREKYDTLLNPTA